jgi:DNA (cytosine-5)-methyltransferase 1
MVSSEQDFFSIAYVATWPRFGTLVSGKLYRQPTLARHIEGIASGSSASMNWMTPNTMDSLDPKSQEALEHEATHRAGRSDPNNLRDQVSVREGMRNWPTATASDAHTDNLTSTQQTPGSMHSVTLPQAVTRDWPTPTAAEGTKIGSQANYGQMGLSNHPAIVGEPTRPKGEKSRSGPPRTDSGPPAQDSGSTGGSRAESWATPRTKDADGWRMNEARLAAGKPEDTLTGQVTPKGTGGKLNPSWVETLMAFPIGWSQLPTKFVKPRKETP